MTTKQTKEILNRHNRWRRGGNGKPTDPTELGNAIDGAVLRIAALEHLLFKLQTHHSTKAGIPTLIENAKSIYES